MVGKVTQEQIGECITGLIDSFDKELYEKTQGELEGNWFFEYDQTLPLEKTLYVFYDRLRLYASFCRRWEEHHNGNCCVVERVRDTYIMPKIRGLCVSIGVGTNAD